MKTKKLLVLCAILLLVMVSLTAQAQTLTHVADLSNILTDAEERLLNQELASIYEDLGFDSIIITSNSYEGWPGKRFAAEYYERQRSPKAYPNGAALVYNPTLGPNGDIWEAARGTGERLLGAQGDDALLDVVRPYARQRDYAGMFQAYARYLRASVTPPTPLSVATKYAPFGVIGGFIIGLIAAFSMKAQLRTARRQTAADQYVLRDSLDVTQAHDLYLYETVVRRKIETQRPSGGGGGSFRSSSGTSYSGRGGRL